MHQDVAGPVGQFSFFNEPIKIALKTTEREKILTVTNDGSLVNLESVFTWYLNPA